MANLTLFDPFRTMERLRRDFDFFGHLTGTPGRDAFTPSFAPSLDVTETDAAYLVEAEIPGLDEKEIDITLTENVLTIRGQKREERQEKEGDHHLRERRYGKFSRSLGLSGEIERDKIEATCQNGVLKVTLPKVPEAEPKRIEVKAG